MPRLNQASNVIGKYRLFKEINIWSDGLTDFPYPFDIAPGSSAPFHAQFDLYFLIPLRQS